MILRAASTFPGAGRRLGGGGRLALCAAALACGLAANSVHSQSFQDFLTNRVTLTNASGILTGNNVAATIEPGEPRHGGKIGGHSLWISWVAPTNGVVEFETEGSTFDTLLAAYYFPSTNDTAIDQLEPVATADDSEGFERESEIEFGVLAGQRYEIAVDGYFGATGPLELNWKFESISGPPPVILSTPEDRSVNLGDAVTLVVNLTNATDAEYKWFFNGSELDADTPALSITSFQVTDVGRYRLRIDVDGVRYFTKSAEIQINTDNATNALAQGKLLDAPSTPLIGDAGGSSPPAPPEGSGPHAAGDGVGVVRGYNGSQIFDTAYATVDPAEPAHCGVSNGVSYWLIYQPPANGTITLDTIGSTYDTVMEIYTYNGALNGYPDLIPLDCSNDAVGLNGASRVILPVVKTRQYIVAVEGVGGARGTAWLNYSLNTNQLPQPPALLTQMSTQVAAAGSDVLLCPSLTGSAPLQFSWKKNSTPLPGQIGSALFLPSVTTEDSASYVVTVTNDVGSLQAALPLRVLVPPPCDLRRVSTGLSLSFPTEAGQRYTIEEADAVTGPWQPWPNFYAGDGAPVMVYIYEIGTRFYRVRVE